MKEKLLIIGYILSGLAVIYAFFPVTIVSIVPIYPGATQVERHDYNMGGYTFDFVTTDSPASVRGFYDNQFFRTDFPTELHFGGPWSEKAPRCADDPFTILKTTRTEYTILLNAWENPETHETRAVITVLPGTNYKFQTNCGGMF